MALPAQVRSGDYRALLEQFIEAYRREPCLWQLKNRDYYNREKKSAAVGRLLPRLRALEPAAARADVMRKVNSMRTTYNKERRKVLEAEAEGGARVPKLWCYGLLAFLDEKDAAGGGAGGAGGLARRGRASGDEDVLEMEQCEVLEETDEKEVTIEHNALSLDSDSEDPIRVPRAKKRKSGVSRASDTAPSGGSGDEAGAEGARGAARRGGGGGAADRHDAYCGSLACKLRALPRRQRLLAERLINAVLFEAEWGSLTRRHRLAH